MGSNCSKEGWEVEIILTENDIERFWSKVDKSGDCWLWKGSSRSAHKDYGCFWLDGRTESAHRIAWVIYNKVQIPEGMNVLHKCDNPPCVRDIHLFVGNDAENFYDMYNKGRWWVRRGEQRPEAKLTGEQVVDILKAYCGGALQKDLAEKYSMTQQGISDIVRRKNWKHVVFPQ